MSEEIYRQRILDHYKNPRHYGRLKKYTHSSIYKKRGCDDKLSFQVLLNKNTIKDIAFTADGRALTIASASMLADFLIGKEVTILKKLNLKDIEKLLGAKISDAHVESAMLGLETLRLLTPV
jgi:nitrogen fixation protein NifU and related proteins